MKTQLQLTLLIAAALYLAWGLGLMLAPTVTQSMISVGTHDPAVTALLAASFLGLMISLLIAARNPVKELVRAVAVSMALIGFTGAYFMFAAKAMPLSGLTLMSLLVDLGAAAVLFLIEGKLDIQRHARTGQRASV